MSRWILGYDAFKVGCKSLHTRTWGFNFDPYAGNIVGVKIGCNCMALIDNTGNIYKHVKGVNLNKMFEAEPLYRCITPCRLDAGEAKAALNYFRFQNKDAKYPDDAKVANG